MVVETYWQDDDVSQIYSRATFSYTLPSHAQRPGMSSCVFETGVTLNPIPVYSNRPPTQHGSFDITVLVLRSIGVSPHYLQANHSESLIPRPLCLPDHPHRRCARSGQGGRPPGSEARILPQLSFALSQSEKRHPQDPQVSRRILKS